MDEMIDGIPKIIVVLQQYTNKHIGTWNMDILGPPLSEKLMLFLRQFFAFKLPMPSPISQSIPATMPATRENDGPEDALDALNEDERWWRNRYEMLLKHGYQLRPRFRPGWTPSWAGTKKSFILCEDGLMSLNAKTMDAKRLSDGKRIKMKRLIKGRKELEIAQLLSTKEMLQDPRNHCVPVLDVFSEEDSRLEFMVMPLLQRCFEPPFSFVEEVVDFMKQMIEGLVFVHEHGVAHRDCAQQNIMMDADRLYPKGFHPNLPTADAYGMPARPRRRRNVPGIKYYFVDFGISTRFDGTEEMRLVTGSDGLDQDVPELNESEPYDPFPVDVFILGNLFRKRLVRGYKNCAFLEPLVASMTQRDPSKRPTAQQALEHLTELVEKQHPRSVRWAVIHRGETNFERFIWSTESAAHEVAVLVKSIFSFRKRS